MCLVPDDGVAVRWLRCGHGSGRKLECCVNGQVIVRVGDHAQCKPRPSLPLRGQPVRWVRWVFATFETALDGIACTFIVCQLMAT